MALEKIGLGGILSFDPTRAIGGMNRAKAAFKSLGTSAKRMGAGVRQMGMGLGQLSIVGAGAGLVVGSMTKKFVDFEQQMSGVQAVSRASAEDMKLLTSQAKKLGATTAFTAVQAGEAQELLSRAGFSVNEVLSATPAILSAAAAEGMELATAADIVANSIRGMGLQATDAAHVSDVLALASASANTNMVSLGEGMKFAAPQARTLGFSLEETVAALGKISDSGIKGTLAGTSFTNMLVKLGRPSAKATAYMKQWGIELENADGSIKPLSEIVGQFKTNIDAIPGAVQRAAAMTELFGIRGQKAFSALAAAGPEAISDLTKMLEQSSEGVGAAEKMARTRLDNIAGAVTILKSAWEGLSIEVGGYITKQTALKEGVQGLTAFIADLVLTLQGEKERVKDVNGEMVKYELATTTAGRVAKGLKQGIDFISNAIKTSINWVRKIGEQFGFAFGGDMITQIAKVGTIIVAILAALAPIGAIAFTLGIAFSGLASIVTGLGTIFGAVFSFGGLAIAGLVAAVVGAFVLIQKDGESVMDTFKRIFDNVKAGVSYAWNAIKQFAQGYKEGIQPAFKVAVDMLSNLRKEVAGAQKKIQDIVKSSGVLETDWKAIGKTIAGFASSFYKFFGPSMESFLTSLIKAGSTVATSLLPALKGIWTILKPILLVNFAPVIGGFILTYKVLLPLLGKVIEGVAWIFGLVVKVAGWIGDKFAPVWDLVVNGVKNVIAYLANLWEAAKIIAKAYWDMATTIWGAIAEVIMPVVKKAGEFIAGVWQWVANVAKKAWSWITDKVILPAWNWIKGIASKIRDAFVSALTSIRNVAASIFGKLTTILAAPFQTVLDFIAGIIKKIAGTEIGKAALQLAGVSLEAVKKFQTTVATTGIKAIKGEPLAKAVEEGSIEAAEKSPATKAMKAKAQQQGQTVGAQQPCVTVDNKVGVDVKSDLSVDGSEMSVASAKHQAEISERSGGETTPWQQRKILEVGAIPATGGVPT